MTTTPDTGLYPLTPGHVAGSDTSEAAAASMNASAAGYRERVFAMFALGNWTCDALEERMNLSHQTVSARIRELVLAGRLTDSGERRKTRSGRKAAVWMVKA